MSDTLPSTASTPGASESSSVYPESTTDTRVEAVTPPPNGKVVTLRDLHAFMYVKDQADTQRFNIVLEQIGGVRRDLSTHIADTTKHSDGSVIRAEIERDAAKAGVAAKWLGLGLVVAGAITGLVVSATKGWLGLS